MLTGLNTPRHGIYTVADPDRGEKELRKLISYPNRLELPEGIQILPQILKEAGYQTFHVGKWHVTKDPCSCGVDINIAGNHAGNPSTYFAPYNNVNLIDGPKGEFLTDRLGDEAVNLINQADESKPFFLYYATYAVHTPLQAPDDLVEKYCSKKGNDAHNNPVYAALVEAMDRNVGKVLQAISNSSKADNTIIVFTSDNGGVYDISKQWPLRAGKGAFYEGGIRVPLIIYQPKRFERKECVDVAVSQLDILPTIMDFAGISKELLLDGCSLIPLLEGRTDITFRDRPLYWHFPAYLEGGNIETVDMHFRTRPVSVILLNDWKLIENYEDGRIELYNLKEDIGEKNEVSQLYPQKARELKLLLERWKEETNAPCHFERNPYYKELP